MSTSSNCNYALVNAFNNPVNLKKLINMIDEEEWTGMDVDVKGAAFEGLLEKSASEGKKGAGQYPLERRSTTALLAIGWTIESSMRLNILRL